MSSVPAGALTWLPESNRQDGQRHGIGHEKHQNRRQYPSAREAALKGRRVVGSCQRERTPYRLATLVILHGIEDWVQTT